MLPNVSLASLLRCNSPLVQSLVLAAAGVLFSCTEAPIAAVMPEFVHYIPFSVEHDPDCCDAAAVVPTTILCASPSIRLREQYLIHGTYRLGQFTYGGVITLAVGAVPHREEETLFVNSPSGVFNFLRSSEGEEVFVLGLAGLDGDGRHDLCYVVVDVSHGLANH